MQRAADTSRFLIDFFSNRGIADSDSVVSHDGLLQYVLNRLAQTANSRQVFNQLARKYIQLAEHAFSLRNVNALQEASLVLMNLPIGSARQVGLYYQALAFSRNGEKNKALALLEKVADNAPLAYRARALMTSGAIHQGQGRLDDAIRFYPEAIRLASHQNGRDLQATLMTYLNTSFIRSDIGDHQGVLADLEKLLPLVLLVAQKSPLYFYIYQADLAYELSQVGRIAEAEAACAIALASPFATAYPEWRETRNEIAAKRQSASPSVVAINRALETETAYKPEPKVDTSPIKAVAFSWLSEYLLSQRTIALIDVPAAIAKDELSQVLLDRVGKSIQARAPPALS